MAWLIAPKEKHTMNVGCDCIISSLHIISSLPLGTIQMMDPSERFLIYDLLRLKALGGQPHRQRLQASWLTSVVQCQLVRFQEGRGSGKQRALQSKPNLISL